MASDRKQKQSNSIPIRFFDGDDPRASEDDAELEERAARSDTESNSKADAADPEGNDTGFGGPDLAELVASRAELKRLQTALDEDVAQLVLELPKEGHGFVVGQIGIVELVVMQELLPAG